MKDQKLWEAEIREAVQYLTEIADDAQRASDDLYNGHLEDAGCRVDSIRCFTSLMRNQMDKVRAFKKGQDIA